MDILPHKKYKILLIGDDGIDEYQYGTADRMSSEAPVPVFLPDHTVTRPGMAGNVRHNLERLGCSVHYLHSETSIKTRLIDIRSKQHIARIDRDARCTPVKTIDIGSCQYDAIVISDYNKGSVTYELIEHFRRDFAGPIFVDTKKTDLARLEGCVVKINESEFSVLKTVCRDLVVTMGPQGARYQGRIFPARSIEVIDVCGAGDTFLSALCYRYLDCQDIAQSVRFALLASAVTVQHSGVYAPSLEEIL